MQTHSDVRPTAVVAAAYEAFGRGDVPGVLAALADDVVLEDTVATTAAEAGHPLLSPRHGKEEVGQFFAALGAYEFHRFEPLDFLTSEFASTAPGGTTALRHVAVRVHVDQTAPSGFRFEDDEIHLWGIGEDGLVHSIKHYCDTARQIASM
jgi:ketosteroid isomerase-like protein